MTNFTNATLPTGEKWEVYLSKSVPELLKAGGHPVSREAWDCHDWTNCPMAQAFVVHSIGDIPSQFQDQVEQFIRFFDARLIPCPSYL